MPSKAELQQQFRSEVDAARAILDNAAGRDLTPDEQTRADGHVKAAEQLRKSARQAAGDQAVRDAIAGLDHGIYGGPATSPKVKALGGSGGWSRKVIGDVPGKALLPSGAVPVSVPLNPEPVRTDAPVLALRQLLPTQPDTTGRFSYLRQTARTNNADVVAPGARKPTSVFSLERIEERCRVIAHLSEPISRMDLDDAPALQNFLDEELRLGLELALEDEIVNGSGTGEHFTGIANVSGSQSQVWTTDLLTTLRKSVTALEVLGLTAGAWILSPADWERVELTANTSGYSMAQAGQAVPVERAARRLWSAPVVVSTAVTAGTGYLLDLGSVELRIREDARIDWSEAVYDPDRFGTGDGGTAFEANEVVFRAEGRFGFAVTRPAGVVEVDLTA